MPLFTFIVPVYNRPDEVAELLASLAAQTDRDFDVVLVEDGSKLPCSEVAEAYRDRLTIHYYAKENTGAGPSRNYGIARSEGEYLLFVDSDCILPPDYIAQTKAALAAQPADYWGGPDRAHPHFNAMQRAISFTMTSWLTTGGIRGTRQNKKFNPRTFNMGIRRSLMQQLGGFLPFWPGEDLELAIRARKQGYTLRLFPQVWVYHKRRNTLKSYYRQVRNFGRLRIHVHSLHPEALKPMHLLPAAYTCFTLAMLLLWWVWLPYTLVLPGLWLLYQLALLAESSLKNGLKVGLLSLVTTQIMMFGYGLGLMGAAWRRWVQGKPVV